MPIAGLEFLSPQMALSTPDDGAVFAVAIDGWTVAERLGRDEPRIYGGRYDSYSVALQYDVPAADDPGSAYIEGCYLSLAIDKAWMYATGLPMSPRGFDHFLTPTHPARDWSSNGAEVIPESDWSLLNDGVVSVPRYRRMPWRPLERTMLTFAALRNASDELGVLAALHYQANRTLEPELHFLLLAKAMEIAREVFAGASADAKERALPSYVRERLSRPLNWSFEMCQQRRQTRHVIDKRGGISVKPDFSSEEERDFLHDTHLLLCHAVTAGSSLPLTIDDNGTAVEAA